jgi:hypothetical protein
MSRVCPATPCTQFQSAGVGLCCLAYRSISCTIPLLHDAFRQSVSRTHDLRNVLLKGTMPHILPDNPRLIVGGCRPPLLDELRGDVAP